MTDDNRIGDGPVQPAYYELMNAIAHALDETLNTKERPKQTGFILMVFPFGSEIGRCNYISNANREDVKVMLREQLARFEGMPDIEGRA